MVRLYAEDVAAEGEEVYVAVVSLTETRGDGDRDGAVNTLDSLMILRFAVGLPVSQLGARLGEQFRCTSSRG